MKESNEATLRLQELRRLQRQDRKRRLEGSLRQAYLVATGGAYPDLVFPCSSCGEALVTTAQYTGFEAYCCRCGNLLEIPDCESNDFGISKFGRELQRTDVLAGQATHRLDASYLAQVSDGSAGESRSNGSADGGVEILGPESSRGARRSEHNVVLSIVVNRDGDISTIPSVGGDGGRTSEDEGKGPLRRGGQRAIKTPVKSTLELAITSDGGREAAPSLTVWQSQNEQREWERLVAFGLLGMLLVVVTAFCIYLFLNNSKRDVPPATADNSTTTETASTGPQGVRELPISAVAPADLEEAKWVIRHYITAATWRERLPYVRMPERVTPLMEEFYQKNPDGVINHSSMEVTWAGYVRGHFLIVITVGDTNYKEYYFTLERMGDEYKIDWEVLVEYNPMSWKEFREKRPTEPVMFRVSLTADQYYNFQFADATKFQCFRLASRDEFVGLYGYAPRAAEWFKDVDLAPGFTRLVMVEMRFPDSAQGSNQVEISNFVRPSWVVFPEDLDSSVPAPENMNSLGAPGTPVAGAGPEDKARVRYTERPSGPMMSTGKDVPKPSLPPAPKEPQPAATERSGAVAEKP